MDYLLLSNKIRNGQKKIENYSDYISNEFDDVTVPDENNMYEPSEYSLSDVPNEIKKLMKTKKNNSMSNFDLTNFNNNKLIAIAISIISGYLAWSCNSKMAFGKRIAITLLSCLFGMFYIAYAITFITSQCSNEQINMTSVTVNPSSFGYVL